MTNKHCNAWECEHNKNGYCESEDISTECYDEFIEWLAEFRRCKDNEN